MSTEKTPTIRIITIPVQPIGQAQVEYSTPSGRAASPVSLSKSTGIITVKVLPVNEYGQRVGIITIPVSMIGDNDCCEDYTDIITWERKPKQWDQEGDVVAIDAYPTLTVALSTCCQWTAFLVRLKGPGQPGAGSLFWEYRPEKLPVESVSESRMQSQNLIPPGGKLELAYEFWNGERRRQETADYTYWCTCCFTGGWIKSISGQPGTQDVTYTVEIMGQDRLCRPSDYLSYSVGQWVFVGRQSSECSDHARLGCKKACDEQPHTDPMMMIPIEVGNFSDGGTHQYIEYGTSDVPELFDTCLKPATIIEIDHDNNQADVDVAGLGRLNGVPFFVHPPGEDTVDGASALFQADNLVTVLYHPDFQYIIGLGIVQYWEDWNGPNIATNHPWDLVLYDFDAPGIDEINALPADAPEYVGGWGSYVKIENGTLKMRCHGGSFATDGYNNIYLYLRAQEQYQIDAPAGIMIINIERAESPGVNNDVTMFFFGNNGKSAAIGITLSSEQGAPDWNADFTYYVDGYKQEVSGTFTVNLVEIGLTMPIMSSWIQIGSGTEDAVLEINEIDFL